MNHVSQFFLPDGLLLAAGSVGVGVTVIAVAAVLAERLRRTQSMPSRYGLLLAGLVMCLIAPAIVGAARWANVGLWELPTPAEPAIAEAPVIPPPTLNAPPPQGVSFTPNQFSTSVTLPPILTVPHDEPALPGEPLPAAAPPSVSSTFRWLRAAASAVGVVWLLGCVVMLARLLRGLLGLRRLTAGFEPCREKWVLSLGRRAAAILDVSAPPIVLSAKVPTPMVVGLWRPVIVLPFELLDELDESQLEAVLLHETAHIAHGDLAVGLLQQFAGVAFWWCPVLHILNRRLAELREDLADNAIIATQGDGLGFARVLVDLAARLRRTAVPDMAGALSVLSPNRGGLEGRVARLLQEERDTVTHMNRMALSVAGLFAVAMGAVMLALTVREAASLAADPEAPPAAKPDPIVPESDFAKRIAADDFWAVMGATFDHKFSTEEVETLRNLEAKSPSRAVRLRANRLLVEYRGNLRVHKDLPGALAGQALAAVYRNLEAHPGDAKISQYAPELGSTHISVTRKSDDPADVWVLIETVGGRPNDYNGGLNLCYEPKHGRVVRHKHWGEERTPPAEFAALRAAPPELILPAGVLRHAHRADEMNAARVVYTVGQPWPLRLSYAGGAKGWDGELAVRDGKLIASNGAVLKLTNCLGASEIAPRPGSVDTVQANQILNEPFSTELDLSKLYDLPPGDNVHYILTWGSGETTMEMRFMVRAAPAEAARIRFNKDLASNQRCLLEEYAKLSAEFRREHNDKWIVIAGGQMWPRGSGDLPKPAATLAEADDAADRGCQPGTQHRFVIQIGRDANREVFLGGTPEKSILGSGGLTVLGKDWVVGPDGVTFGKPAVKVGVRDPKRGPLVEAELSAPGAAESRTVTLQVATGFEGEVLLSADEAARLGLGRWMVPGLARLKGIQQSGTAWQAMLRVRFPAAKLDENVRVMVWNEPEIALSLELHRGWAAAGQSLTRSLELRTDGSFVWSTKTDPAKPESRVRVRTGKLPAETVKALVERVAAMGPTPAAEDAGCINLRWNLGGAVGNRLITQPAAPVCRDLLTAIEKLVTEHGTESM